jgi:hypothetical protein
MKKESVNKAFILLDKTLKQKAEIAKQIQAKDKEWYGSIGNRTDHDPEGLKYKKCTENPLLWQMTEPDHNGTYVVFLFKTVNKYRNTSHEYRDVIIKNSELRKVLLKNKIAEVGITIEDSLHYPTETCWGYSFHGYKYYIIKDGETTFTDSRAVIRKIYNGKPIEDDRVLIRIGEYEGEKTIELDELTRYDKDLYHCVIDEQEYLIGDEDSILNYGCDMMFEDENKNWLIKLLGGIDEVVNSYLRGRSFNIKQYFGYNWEEFASFMELDKEEWRKNDSNRIQHSNYDTDSNREDRLSGLKLYKLNR